MPNGPSVAHASALGLHDTLNIQARSATTAAHLHRLHNPSYRRSKARANGQGNSRDGAGPKSATGHDAMVMAPEELTRMLIGRYELIVTRIA